MRRKSRVSPTYPQRFRSIDNVLLSGSLDDKNIRLEMDNIIFQRLREVILQPCRDRDWFGLAEQVINTIYALGEQPDDLCSDIIKVMTKRVFDKPKRDAATEEKETDPDAMDEDPPADAPEADAASQPANGTTGLKDTADAFELSQLLFVVGHVAMKQIVFLEIIEREMKRQKDVAAAGASPFVIVECQVAQSIHS